MNQKYIYKFDYLCKRVGLRTSWLKPREQRGARIKLVAFNLERMSSTPRQIMAFQYQNILLVSSQKSCTAQSSNATPYNNNICLWLACTSYCSHIKMFLRVRPHLCCKVNSTSNLNLGQQSIRYQRLKFSLSIKHVIKPWKGLFWVSVVEG